MKFEMTISEFETFCAQVGKNVDPSRLQKLEGELETARSDLALASEDLDYLRDENRAFRFTIAGHESEVTRLRALVKDLQDQLIPNRKELGLSRVFAEHFGGRKVMAVKELKELFKTGLKDAKDTVEGTFKDEGSPILFTLSQIFAGLEKKDPADLQRVRLLSLLDRSGNDVLAQELDDILAGTYHTQPAP